MHISTSTAMNMYALHEHGESHDENSDNDSSKLKADNIASPDDFDQTERDHTDTDQNVSR